MNSVEIEERRVLLKEEAQQIFDNCRAEVRMMTDEETTRYEDIKKELRHLKIQLKEINNTLEPTEDEKTEQKRNKIEINTMEKKFSLVKAIRNVANNAMQDDVTTAVIEAGKSEMRKSGLSYGGQIQLPTQELRTISVEVEGEDLVPTDIWDIMEPLRSKNVLVAAGARFITGLVGNVQIPTMNGNNCGWEGELDMAGTSGATFGHVTLSPKRLTCYVDISKQLLNQDAVGVEEMIRKDILNSINSELEKTILGNEAETSKKPAGIFSLADGDNTVENATTMAKIAEMEEMVEEANVIGACKYIVSPKVKASLRDKAKGGNVAQSLFVNNEIDGTQALSTTHVEKGKMVYGDFSNLTIGQWGVVDLTVDQYTKAVDGQIRLVVNAYFDAKVARPEAFAFGTV